MSTKPSRFGAVLYGDEATFGESSPTIDTRLRVLGMVDVSGLTQETIETPFTAQYASGGWDSIRGPKGGSFSIELELTGAGTDPNLGTITATDLYTLLGYVLGGSYNGTNGADADGGGTATVFDATGITASDWSGVRIGVLGDGRGEGQVHMVSGVSSNTLTLHNGVQTTPSAGDDINAMMSVFPVETVASTDSITGLAFRLLTGNRRYDCHGCYCTGISFSGLNPREYPRVTLTFGVSWWETTTQSFPSAVADAAKDPAPVMNGSLWLNSSATYNTECVRSFDISIDHSVTVLESVCASNSYQVVTDAKLDRSIATVSMVLDAEANGTNTWLDHYDAENALRCGYTMSTGGGKTVAFYFPNLKFTDKPRQIERNGLNAIELNMRAVDNTSTTDRARAAWHLLMG